MLDLVFVSRFCQRWVTPAFKKPDAEGRMDKGLFGLYPNGLFTFGLSLIGLQTSKPFGLRPFGLRPIGLPMMFGLPRFGLQFRFDDNQLD